LILKVFENTEWGMASSEWDSTAPAFIQVLIFYFPETVPAKPINQQPI